MSGQMYTSTVSDTSRLFRDRTTSEILKLSDTYEDNRYVHVNNFRRLPTFRDHTMSEISSHNILSALMLSIIYEHYCTIKIITP